MTIWDNTTSQNEYGRLFSSFSFEEGRVIEFASSCVVNKGVWSVFNWLDEVRSGWDGFGLGAGVKRIMEAPRRIS